MPLPLEVLTWVAIVSLALVALTVAVFAAAVVAAVLELRALIRALGQEVLWWRTQRRYFSNRARFAGKWLRIMGERFIG